MPFSDSAIGTCSSASSQHFTLNLTKYSHFLKALLLQRLDCLNASGFQWKNKAKHCNPLYSTGMPKITPAQLVLQNQKAGESPLYTSPFGISEKLAICTAASHHLDLHSCRAQAARVTYRLKQGWPVLRLCLGLRWASPPMKPLRGRDPWAQHATGADLPGSGCSPQTPGVRCAQGRSVCWGLLKAWNRLNMLAICKLASTGRALDRLGLPTLLV